MLRVTLLTLLTTTIGLACDAPGATPEPTSTVSASAASAAPAAAGSASTSASAAMPASATPSASGSARPSAPPTSDRLLSCSLDTACVVTTSGGVQCWGRDGFGQLGTGTARKGRVHAPGPLVKGLPEARAVAAGLDFACALSRQGEVYCWGSNYSGQSGNGAALPNDPGVTAPSVLIPSRVGLAGPAVAIDAGVSHACAVLADGKVECWGANEERQLGVAGTDASSTPIRVPGLDSAVEVSLGVQHSCARRADGSVACWGAAPSDPAPGYCAAQISAGSGFTCAVACAGGAHCWGAMPGLTAGVDPIPQTPTPILGALVGVQEIRAGYNHLCARDAAGDTHCWGINDGGELGIGKGKDWDDDARREPEKVAAAWGQTAALCAGGMLVRGDGSYRRPASYVEPGHSCALAASGDVYCWGGPEQRYEPARVTRR